MWRNTDQFSCQTPDLTKKQRALQKTLKAELNEKKENGDDGWTIKHWKVVKKTGSGSFRFSQQKRLNHIHIVLYIVLTF